MDYSDEVDDLYELLEAAERGRPVPR